MESVKDLLNKISDFSKKVEQRNGVLSTEEKELILNVCVMQYHLSNIGEEEIDATSIPRLDNNLTRFLLQKYGENITKFNICSHEFIDLGNIKFIPSSCYAINPSEDIVYLDYKNTYNCCLNYNVDNTRISIPQFFIGKDNDFTIVTYPCFKEKDIPQFYRFDRATSVRIADNCLQIQEDQFGEKSDSRTTLYTFPGDSIENYAGCIVNKVQFSKADLSYKYFTGRIYEKDGFTIKFKPCLKDAYENSNNLNGYKK